MGAVGPATTPEVLRAASEGANTDPNGTSAGIGDASGHRLDVITLPVLGMTCSACQSHVEGALRAARGVSMARVDLMRHRARVEFDPAVIQGKDIVEVIRASGYDAVLPRGADPVASQVDGRGDGWKAALTILAGLAAMILSMPPRSSANPGTGWMIALPAGPVRWSILCITLGLAVWAGGTIYRSAMTALLHRETNMNTLVSLGTGVAFVYSAWVVVAGGGDVYFDSVLLILGFLLLGKWLEKRAKHSALASVDALARLQPATARVRRTPVKDGPGGHLVEEEIPIEQLMVGDIVVVLPGERIPVDAVVESGRTTVDESMLTGESVPLERGIGERVLAGTVNYDGAIVTRVVSTGAETTLAQIARLVESAQSSRAPMERLADRASAIFVPVVLGLAVLTLAGWMLATHDIRQAIVSTVAVLVIACPCAMGLAVPAALTVAIGRGAQAGVLIKGGEALERLANLDAVMMDKTGTLTVGRPELVGAWTADWLAGAGFAEEDLLRMAAAAEDHSAHPLAHAVVSRAKELGVSWPAADAMQSMPGRGISAEAMGHALLLGNVELMREWAVPFPDATKTDGFEAEPAMGVTRLWIAVHKLAGQAAANYRLAGYFDAKDTARPSAAGTVRWLVDQGIQVAMLTGDSAGAAGPLAKTVGITDVFAGLLPADKVEKIRELQQAHGNSPGLRVAMVGDGINDAAAMAQADAGIAMGSGAALAQEAGDVLLLRSDPAGVVAAIALAHATVRVMRQNLVWAMGYNVIGIPLAAGLLYPAFHLTLTPWMAAAAMAFSSVSVLVNSLRLRGWTAPVILAG